MTTSSGRVHVVIVGAGFAGLNAAKQLLKKCDSKSLAITIVDRRNHHLFQPLLYQVATAGLSPAEISTPIRHIFADDENVNVVLDEVVGIDAASRVVRCRNEKISYDYLVLACGANHSYFGKNEWEEFAPGLKTIEQATEIRRRILSAFEEAEKCMESDSVQAQSWMTFVIVGGGPTGVELAGAITELSQHTIKNEFRKIDPAKAKVILIEASPRVLAAFDESLSLRAKKDLEELGVEVRTATRVTEVSATGVQLENAVTISARTVLWAAGVAPSKTGKLFDAPIELDRSGRVVVNPELNLKNHANIFVIGDQAHVKGADGNPLPGLAPVAMQEGRHAADNIIRMIEKKNAQPFAYFDKGAMATIGRKRAVLQAGKIKFAGLLAWLAWLLIHIYYLIGFKNRFFVFLQWTWSYFSYSRSARLIVDKDWRLRE